ncbi:MAG TPA: ribosomal-processing cysteine protease Prp [Bacillota bacterium]|nr:ribosomal-processing cysteine protease Prp [Bacillota bacterium]HOK68629.1 ribosomal-processing cysteine protease Prp [Bacillota bacterium]HPP84741.1 ribosomal-processing cysteine protease Prp [Bacillota bacterium]
MIKAVFFVKNDAFSGFEISGHSGAAPAGKDIVCAAVSAMTMLVVNTICGEYGKKAETTEDADTATVSFRLLEKDSASEGLIRSFYNELAAIEKDYPKNLKVDIQRLEQ